MLAVVNQHIDRHRDNTRIDAHDVAGRQETVPNSSRKRGRLRSVCISLAVQHHVIGSEVSKAIAVIVVS